MDFITQAGLKNRVRNTNVKLTSFTKDKVPVCGEIDLDIDLFNLGSFKHRFVISNLLTDTFLIGMDFLQKNQFSIIAGQRFITSPLGSVEYHNRPKNVTSSIKIRCNKTVTLSPNSVNFIVGELVKPTNRDSSKRNSRSSESLFGTVQPYNNFEQYSGVKIARSINYALGGKLPLQCGTQSTDSGGTQSTESRAVVHGPRGAVVQSTESGMVVQEGRWYKVQEYRKWTMDKTGQFGEAKGRWIGHYRN